MYFSMQDIDKSFAGRQILRGVTIKAQRGQFVALLGPSGCGKTTLLNAIAGLIPIDGGQIRIGDRLYSAPDHTLAPEKRNIGMVFQDFALWPHMTVYDNVAFGLRIAKMPAKEARERVHHVLSIVHMNGKEQHYPHQLSGGQKQRVAIARALAPAPSIVLMDEPLSSLDAALREEMRWELLNIVRTADTTTIYVTHDQVEALTMADHIVLLRDGSVEQQGSPPTIYCQPATPFVASFFGANTLSGQVVATGPSDGQLAVRVGDVVLPCNCEGLQGPVSAGMDAVLAIHPSDIRVVKDGAAPDDGAVVQATIRQRAYTGAGWHYRAALKGADVTCEFVHAAPLAQGMSVALEFPVGQLRLVQAGTTGGASLGLAANQCGMLEDITAARG